MAAALGAGTAWAGRADAAATFTFVEQGGNVVGTLSGSLDITGLSSIGDSVDGASVDSGLAFLRSAPAAATGMLGYDVAGPLFFGPGGGNVAASARSGLALNLFGGLIGGGLLFIESSYSSGDAMTGSMTFAGTGLAGIHVTPGSYTYTLRNQDTFTLVFREVPAPASLPLLAGALGMLGLAGALRRKG
jgi:hypothetical protein